MKSHKNTLVQRIVNNPRAAVLVNDKEVSSREEFGIQIKHLDLIQCFTNCDFGNGFFGNTARGVLE